MFWNWFILDGAGVSLLRLGLMNSVTYILQPSYRPVRSTLATRNVIAFRLFYDIPCLAGWNFSVDLTFQWADLLEGRGCFYLISNPPRKLCYKWMHWTHLKTQNKSAVELLYSTWQRQSMTSGLESNPLSLWIASTRSMRPVTQQLDWHWNCAVDSPEP